MALNFGQEFLTFKKWTGQALKSCKDYVSREFFAYSYVTAACLLLAGLALCLKSLQGDIIELFRLITNESLAENDRLLSEVVARNVLGGLGKLLLAFYLLAFSLLIIQALFQSKFYFSFSLLQPQVERINPFKLPSLRKFIGRTLFLIFVLVSTFVLAWIVLRPLSLSLLGLFGLDLLELENILSSTMTTVLTYLLLGLFCLALLSWIFARILFAVRHQMAPEELSQGEGS